MAFISPLSIIITRSAAHRCGNPCHWSKGARPPPTQPTTHLTFNYHVFHIQSVNFCIVPNHTSTPFDNFITHAEHRHVTSWNHTLIHWFTSSHDVLNLTVEGCWMYWHSIGIYVDDDDDFPTLSFILIAIVSDY